MRENAAVGPGWLATTAPGSELDLPYSRRETEGRATAFARFAQSAALASEQQATHVFSCVQQERNGF